MDLKNITYPIREYLDLFNNRYYESISVEGFFVDKITQHVLNKNGKRIRPILNLLSAKLAGGITSQTIRCALMIELLHTASLIHDDVIDQSQQRRGDQTINNIWGNNTAVLYGDYLYGKCLEIMETESDFKLLPYFAKIGRELPLGELLQKEVSENLDYSEDSYFKVISKKTAALLEVSAELGAISSMGASIETINSLKTFGFYMGLAFQVRDDILDLSPEFDTGKPFGNDILEKKITLPLIYMLNDLDEKERNKILNFIDQDSKKEKEILSLIHRINEGGYYVKAEEKVLSFCRLAEVQLNQFAQSDTKSSLIELLYSLAKRTN